MSLDEERFWSKVDRKGPDDCWEWVGNRHKRGYGVFWLVDKNVRANRYSLELAAGPPPFDGAIALHSCDNPPCCNPRHLRWGTHQDNSDDRTMRRGPMIGEASPTATITNDIVATIYARRLSGFAIGDIAAEIGIPYTTVENVYIGRSWAHRLGVDGNPTLSELRASKPRRKRIAPNRVLTDDMVDRIFQGRMSGLSAKQLSMELGLPKGTVSPVHSGHAFTERLGKHGNPTLEQLRSVRAENPTHKMTEDDVSEIRALLAQGYVGKDIAERYGVSRAIVSHIKTGKR